VQMSILLDLTHKLVLVDGHGTVSFVWGVCPSIVGRRSCRDIAGASAKWLQGHRGTLLP
jgi:hypothetical protein